MAEAILAARGLSRRFGGLMAVREVSLALERGRIHALIGPNGAGKTTLVNLLSGELRPSAGSILFEGREIAGRSPYTIARRGIARSYQRVNLFADFSAFENCRLAAQARGRSSLIPARSKRSYAEKAEQALALVGLSALHRPAGALSHGERRQLEIAVALSTAPKVLLLDEPLAGLGHEESRAMTALIRSIAADHAILLIEHDVDAVLSVADTLTVMVDGAVLASGDPAAVRANRAVQDAYLGSGGEA
jgi:branched-chain amino acid transport system ATP-binding protein